MSNSTPITPSGEAADGSRLTVEDAGSTTHAADLFRNDTTGGAPDASGGMGEDPMAGTTRGDGSAAVAARPMGSSTPPEPAAPAAPGAPEAPSAPSGGLGALAGDDSIAHVFDQTNGVLDQFDGDSDGTAESDVHSAAERADENPAFEAFADTEAPRGDGTEDPRVTGS